MDLLKTVDTVDHMILLRKLRLHAIKGNNSNCMKSYIVNRKQNVEKDPSTKTSFKVWCSLTINFKTHLFLLYVNDL